jgi:putative nucleotidyltransferase with HDIG domain
MKDKKLFLSIADVKPGMITAEPIFNRFGNVLVWDNVVLDEKMIMHLDRMGILTIPVKKEVFKEERKPEKSKYQYSGNFTVDYELNYNRVKQIFDDIVSSGKFNVSEAQDIVLSIIAKSGHHREIIDSVNRERNAEDYTYYHSLNVAMICMMIGKWMRLDQPNIKNLVLSGLLHDIGKAKIPPEILNKPGKLSESEFEEIKRHSQYGYEILSKMKDVYHEVAVAVLTHHEREDGSGYPFGLKGEKLNLYSKIVTLSDIFDAMTANRPYKGKDTPFKVFDLIQNNSFGVLAPTVLKVFLDNVTNYYIGSKVRLNTGETGEVIFMNKMDFSKPVILVNGQYIDTSVSRTIKVEFL